jgi:hypothetical protein
VKRFLVIAILLSYSIASFGINLNLFYCCGQLEAISFDAPQKEKRGCNTEEKEGCCENKTISVKKIQDTQNSSEQIVLQLSAPQLLPAIVHQPNHKGIAIAITGDSAPFYTEPPPDLFPSRRILFCVYRI